MKNGLPYTIEVDAEVGTPPVWFGVEFDSTEPWTNPVDRFDVNGDGQRTDEDAMLLILAINQQGIGPLPAIEAWPTACLDVTGDQRLGLDDVLDLLTELRSELAA